MRIKKYVAETMPEALKLVKADLGPRAVILNTRTTRKNSKLGILGKGQVEVTAAVDDGKGTEAQAPGRAAGNDRRAPRPAAEAAEPRPAPEAAASRPAAARPPASQKARADRPAPGSEWADRISRQIQEMQAALQSAASTGSREGSSFLPGALGPLARQMEDAGVDVGLAQDVLEAILLDPGNAGLKDLKPVQERAVQMLARRFAPPLPIRLGKGVRTVVALVGPAGVGKTTAAAKIAAHFASQENARAAFVAADTDRVGGLEQIRAYAGILGMPVDVVYTPEEMGDAIRSRRDIDLILIDTAGISPLATDQIDALGGLLREAAPNEIHLVLSATSALQQMRDTAAAFSRIEADRLILTKFDETARLGAACTLGAESKLPLSYTTDGRAVPGELHPADAKALARMVFSRRRHAA